jgi:hypothetical protein
MQAEASISAEDPFSSRKTDLKAEARAWSGVF